MRALADLPDLALRISSALTGAGVPHVLTGSLAMAVHGFVRATRNIDILVDVPSPRLPEVFAIVRGFGFEGEDRDLLAEARERSVAELRSGPASVEILLPVLPFHRELVGRSATLDADGVPVPCVSAEDLVVLKLLWMRDRDRADLHALLAAGRGRLDLDRVRRILGEVLPERDFRFAEFERFAAPSRS